MFTQDVDTIWPFAYCIVAERLRCWQ